VINTTWRRLDEARPDLLDPTGRAADQPDDGRDRPGAGHGEVSRPASQSNATGADSSTEM
jgi:hypothetical protein